MSAGANVKAVQRMLGHKSAAMTLDVYADLFDDDLDAVGTALDRAWAVANGGQTGQGHIARTTKAPTSARFCGSWSLTLGGTGGI